MYVKRNSEQYIYIFYYHGIQYNIILLCSYAPMSSFYLCIVCKILKKRYVFKSLVDQRQITLLTQWYLCEILINFITFFP